MSSNLTPQPMVPLKRTKPPQSNASKNSNLSNTSKGKRTQSSIDKSHSSEGSSPDDGRSYQLQKLRKRVRELHKKQTLLRMQLSSLQNQAEFSQQKALKAQQKNRELIQKLSFELVESRQLKFIISQLQQEKAAWDSSIEEVRGEYMELQSTHAKLKDNYTSVTVLLKSIMELLGRARAESVDRAFAKVKELLEKGARFLDGVDASLQPIVASFGDIPKSTHSTEVLTLQKENEELKQSLTSTKQQLQKQRSDKRRILPAYNQILNKLRQSCSALKIKVEEIYNRSERDKQTLQSLVVQKDDLILHLQGKNEQLLGLLKKSEQRERALTGQLAQYACGSSRGSRVDRDRSIGDQEQLALHELDHPANSRSKKGSSSNYIGDWKKVKIKKDLENIDDEIQNIIEEIRNAEK